MKTFRVSGIFCLFFMAMMGSSFLTTGCGSDPVSMISALGESDVQSLDGESFDGVTALRVRAEGMGLSVSPVLRMEQNASGVYWTMEFDASRPLVTVLSYGADGEMGEAKLLDEYEFEVRLDSGEVHAMLSGEPMYMMMHAQEGQNMRFYAMVKLAPLFVQQTGSSLIWLKSSLDLVDMDGKIMLMGHVDTSSRIRSLSLGSDAGIEPQSISTDAEKHWIFTLLPGAVRSLVASPGSRVFVTGVDSNGVEYGLSADVVLTVGELGITSGDDLTF